MRLILLGNHTTNRAKNMRKATWKYAIAAAWPSGVLLSFGADDLLGPSVASFDVLIATTAALYPLCLFRPSCNVCGPLISSRRSLKIPVREQSSGDAVVASLAGCLAPASIRMLENEVIESWSGSTEVHREIVSCVILVVTKMSLVPQGGSILLFEALFEVSIAAT